MKRNYDAPARGAKQNFANRAKKVDDAKSADKSGTTVGRTNRPLGIDVPEHILGIGYILKYNQAIRRHCGINILNYLRQNGEIDDDATGLYVEFKWNKFVVIVNGLRKEYTFYEEMFINSLAAAFKSFAAEAEKTINNFCDVENAIRAEKTSRKNKTTDNATDNE